MTLVVSAHESPLKWLWGRARAPTPLPRFDDDPIRVAREPLDVEEDFEEARVRDGVGRSAPEDTAERAAAAMNTHRVGCVFGVSEEGGAVSARRRRRETRNLGVWRGRARRWDLGIMLALKA